MRCMMSSMILRVGRERGMDEWTFCHLKHFECLGVDGKAVAVTDVFLCNVQEQDYVYRVVPG